MKTNRKILTLIGSSLLSLLAITGLGRSDPARAAAADAQIPCEEIGITLLNSTGTRRIDLMCDLIERGSLDDRLTIIDQVAGGTGPAGWPEIANDRDAVWIFDYKGDSKPELVMILHSRGTALMAELYDSQGDTDRLDYTLSDGQFTLTNQIPASIQVVAPDGWWTRGDLINFNLDILVDGLPDAAFDMRKKLKGSVQTDGTVDFTIRIRDLDRDGRPNYDWRTVHPGPADRRNLERTFLTVNAEDNEAPLISAFPWPYLGKETYGYLTSSPHHTSQPPIQVNWDTGTISAIGEFVSSRGNDAQWFIYSFSEVQAGQMNWPDFESPFAWYDLAEDQDRIPELAIRLGYFWPSDRSFLQGQYPHPINFVRYSWDQDNDDYWDYKLGLVGSNEVTTTVSIDNIDMTMVPYRQLPGWVNTQNWGIVTFVAAEDVRARGEGIYEWDPSSWLIERFFTGRSESPFPTSDTEGDDRRDLRDIQTGFRGEYQMELGGQVHLYISAIDHKLHLMNAQAGLWNLDDHSEIRYANLDSDAYIDEWRYLLNGELERQLNFAGGYLVYSGEDQVTVKQAHPSPGLAALQPPQNKEQWHALDQELAAADPSFQPNDFLAMLDQFDGQSMVIDKAELRDFRRESNGFRFVLDLKPGFSAADPSPFSTLKPGSYVVIFDGSFRVEPLTPPHLSLSAQFLDGEADPSANLPRSIRVQAMNTGLQDAKNLIFVAEEYQNGNDQITEIDRRNIDLLSGDLVGIPLSWKPRAVGVWEIELRIEREDGTVLAEKTLTAALAAGKESSFQTVLSRSTGNGRSLPAFLVLLILALTAAFAVKLNRNRAGSEAEL